MLSYITIDVVKEKWFWVVKQISLFGTYEQNNCIYFSLFQGACAFY